MNTTIVADVNTGYYMEHIDSCEYIVKLILQDSLSFVGGLLRIGVRSSLVDSATTKYFSVIEGSEALLWFKWMKFQFTQLMNSLVNINRGTVVFEGTQIHNQGQVNDIFVWRFPLVYIQSVNSSFAAVDFISSNITNSKFSTAGTDENTRRSGLIFSEKRKTLMVNITSSFFRDCDFNVGRPGPSSLCYFQSVVADDTDYDSSSRM
jgi:hypothetical protein